MLKYLQADAVQTFNIATHTRHGWCNVVDSLRCGSGALNAFTPYQDAPELIPSVINQVDGSKEGDKPRLEPTNSTRDVAAESPLIGRREQVNDVEASRTEVEDVEVQEDQQERVCVV